MVGVEVTRKSSITVAIVLGLALLLRIAFIHEKGYESDIYWFQEWSYYASQDGVHSVASHIWCDYPPGYLYVLEQVGRFYRLFSPDFERDTYLIIFLLKLPAIVADIVTSLLIFLLLRRKVSYRTSLFAMSAYAFNPAIFFNSAYWGQVDAVATLCAFGSITALAAKRNGWSFALITLSILIKMQTIVLLPLIIFVVLRRDGLHQFFRSVGIALFTAFIINLPFIYHDRMDTVVKVLFGSVDHYPYLSMNAYNFWWLFSNAQAAIIRDTHSILNLVSFKTLGLVLFVMMYLLVLKYAARGINKTIDDRTLYVSCAAVCFAFFMLPTQMHERYIFPVFVFLAMVLHRSLSYRVIYGILSVTSFINLFSVLVAYYPGNHPRSFSFLDSIEGETLVISAVNGAVFLYTVFHLLNEMRIKDLLMICCVPVIILSGSYVVNSRNAVYLSDMREVSYSQDWGTLGKDRTVDGGRLSVNGFIYRKGLGTHANSSITYELNGRFRFFEADIGIDDEEKGSNKVSFRVYGDKKLLYYSGLVSGYRDPIHVKVSVESVNHVTLVVKDGGDGINGDHADWLNARVTRH